jgi:formylglycine-generating enzyme required for sulfatase activity
MKMPRKMVLWFCTVVIFFSFHLAWASDIRVENIRTDFRETFCDVEFDLSWNNSWRTSSRPANWDAAWVFLKYRHMDQSGKAQGNWRHATLSTIPGNHHVKHDSNVPAVFSPSEDGKGVFIYRSLEGKGPIRWQGVRLRWETTSDRLPLGSSAEIKVFSVEMVYVPEGAFLAGDGVSPGRIHAGGDPKSPYRVTQDPPRLVNEPGGLWADGTPSKLPSGASGPSPWDNPSGTLSISFPTGHKAFYVMKYEISQGFSAEYLNSLSKQQAQARFPTSQEIAGSPACPPPCRYTITVDANGVYSAAAPTRANIWMNWEDSIAFADWAGLRPMSELEFEKACRGSGQPAVPGEYAWGTTKIVSLTGFDGIDGSGTEKAIPPEANTSFQRIIQGPIRIGLFEGKPTRELSGASYYGAMDLSGNVVEMAVTVGNASGRRFTGDHGDGELTEQGNANVSSWPRGVPSDPRMAQIPNAGFGYRGGDFWNPELDLRVSARNVATFAGARRLFGLGFRAVRTAPVGNP